MEWLGAAAFVMALYCFTYLDKIKHLKAALKRLERKQGGSPAMSKLISGLVNQHCVLTSEEGVRLTGSTEIPCLVLDADDEWIKIRFTDKKKNAVTKLLRIEKIDGIEVTEAKADSE